MKHYVFHPDARAEMNEAAAYYESQQEGLGRRFLAAIQDAITRMRISPRLYPVADLDKQRCFARTFPYAVIFQDGPEQIRVIAIMHLHRDPGYWKRR